VVKIEEIEENTDEEEQEKIEDTQEDIEEEKKIDIEEYSDLKKLAYLIRKRLHADWDLVIALTGEPGTGKSTLAALLGMLIDKRFDLEKSMAFFPNEREVVEEFHSLHKYSVYIIDEAIKVLLKYQFMSSLQQTIVKMYATERWQNKCLGKDTLILMFDGSLKKVQDIKVDDLIMGPDSIPRKVLKTSIGFGKMYKITSYKGDSIIANENHVLSLKYHNHFKERIDNISVKDYLKMSKDYKEKAMLYKAKISFPYKKVTLEPYFLGVWLGDGLSEGQRIANCDEEILEYLRYFAERNNLSLIQNSYCKDSKCQTWNITHGRKGKKNVIKEEMKKLDLINNKHIPELYKVNDEKTRLEVLAGLLDTDGCLSYNHYVIPTKTERLKNDILYLARSLGFSAYAKKSVAKNQSNKFYPYYRITIGGDVWRIPIKIKRKHIDKKEAIFKGRTYQFKYQKDFLKSSIKEIRDIGEDTYYGFEVDKDGLFCLGDFTITHNCTILCIPRFRDLTESFRNHRVKIWIHVVSRGIAIVYIRDDDPHVKDPWHIDDNLKRKEWFFRRYKVIDRKLGQKISMEKRTTNYFLHFDFPDLPDDIKKKYIELKEKSRENISFEEEKIGKKEQKYLDISKKLIYDLHKKGKSLKEIAELTGITKKTIKNFIEEFEKNSINILNVANEKKNLDLLEGIDK
jgi:hypothetical protein